MRWITGEVIFSLLFLGSMLEAIRRYQDPYLIAGLLVAAVLVFLWSRMHPQDSFMFLFTGLICSIGAGYVLFWLVTPILCASIGIFLLHLELLNDRRDILFLLIFSGIITCLTGGIYQLNRMLLPGILIGLAALVFLIYVLFSEYTLRKQYAGDR